MLKKDEEETNEMELFAFLARLTPEDREVVKVLTDIAELQGLRYSNSNEIKYTTSEFCKLIGWPDDEEHHLKHNKAVCRIFLEGVKK